MLFIQISTLIACLELNIVLLHRIDKNSQAYRGDKNEALLIIYIFVVSVVLSVRSKLCQDLNIKFLYAQLFHPSEVGK